MKKDKNLVENETNKNEEQKSIGLCLGMCFGLSIGMSIGSLFDKITIGMVLGEGLGMLLGALCDNFNHKKQGLGNHKYNNRNSHYIHNCAFFEVHIILLS